MSPSSRCISVLLFIFCAPAICSGVKRVKERIYVTLRADHTCFRILNGTKQVGCQSARDGSTGILHFVESQADADYVLRDPGGHSPFVAAMKVDVFSNITLVRILHDSGKLNGMLLIQSSEGPVPTGHFSEDSHCPNEATSLYKNDSNYGSCRKQLWNPHGTGARFMDFKMPIFLINDETDIKILREKCYINYNQPKAGTPPTYPLCAVELTMFNIAAGSAVRCMRRNTLISGLDNPKPNCDPIGDYNVFGFVPPTNKSRPLDKNSVLMLMARMDSFSSFSDYDPGAQSSLSNVIVMLAIAEALGRNKDFVKNSSLATGKYLMPVFFNGESFDYIGSSRLVWEMTKQRFPSSLSDILQDQPALLSFHNVAIMLEFNQLSSKVASREHAYFLHVDPVSALDPVTKAVIENVSAALANISAGLIKPDPQRILSLPPSSVQSVLRANRSVPALVITDHDRQFQNKFYNSFLDDPSRIDRDKVKTNLINLTNTVLKYTFEWVSDGRTPVDWRANHSIIDKITDCLWSWPKWRCDIFDRINLTYQNFSENNAARSAQRTYIGPFKGLYRMQKPVRVFIDYLLSYFLGDRFRMPDEIAKCEAASFSNRTGTIYTYKQMVDLLDNSNNATYCVVSSVDVSEAVSPAFLIDGYDFKSGEYSTWTESVWETPSLRVFLRANPIWEAAVFVVGLLALLVSLVVVYLIARGSDVLFTTTETKACDDATTMEMYIVPPTF